MNAPRTSRAVALVALAAIGGVAASPAPPHEADEAPAPPHQTDEAPAPPHQAAEAPALLLVLTVDQLRPDYLERFGSLFDGGLRRLLDDGAVFLDARQDHAITATAPGHAAILSGRYPNSTGIVDNGWFNRALDRTERASHDPEERLVGVESDGPGGSPRQFLGSSLVGWLKERDPETRAVSISRKDRTAVLTAPEAEHVYYWHAASGRFVTSTYYRDWLPDWVSAFNDSDWLGAHAGGSWELLAPEPVYDISRADDYEGERPPRGFGVTFPHPLPADRRLLGSQIQTTPFMDQATLDLGREAIAALDLGGRGSTDVLAIGLSSTDSIGHAFGPYSREIQDQILRLDRMLGEFLDYVDETVGLDRTLIVLTADHGVVPLPEYSVERGERAERLRLADVYRGIQQHIGDRFGGSRWFRSDSYGWIQVDREQAAELGVDAEEVVRAAREYLDTLDFLEAVFSRDELLVEREPRSELEELVRRSFYAERVGDLYLVTRPLSQWQVGSAANHQSPHDYDRRVALIMSGPGIRPGTYPERVAVVDIAPTLASLLGMSIPGDLSGTVRESVLGGRRPPPIESSADRERRVRRGVGRR